jgi:uncharacterized membrane protein YhhN
MLLALALSGVGDTCLISARSALFLSGLVAFLLAHIAYSVAFATGALNIPALLAGVVLMTLVGVLTLRWLWRHLDAAYKVAISAYVLAIMAMCSLAIASAAASGSWWVALGALAFAASDISVARDRFVAPGHVNKAWGLPVYYVAQLLLAWSIYVPTHLQAGNVNLDRASPSAYRAMVTYLMEHAEWHHRANGGAAARRWRSGSQLC